MDPELEVHSRCIGVAAQALATPDPNGLSGSRACASAGRARWRPHVACDRGRRKLAFCDLTDCAAGCGFTRTAKQFNAEYVPPPRPNGTS